jgi:alkylation response protein AidB-like acyl-CoA dehydrogenase
MSAPVDFTFSPEQEALRQAVRDFLARETPSAWCRAMVDDEGGMTEDVWTKLADLGWLGLLVPERLGGTGLGLIDLVVVQEEMGKLPLPGPYFSSAVCATLAARHLGAEELLNELATGARTATLALEEAGSGDPVARTAVTATPLTPTDPDHGDWSLDGLKPIVLDGHHADVAIVIARTAEGLAAFSVDAPRATLVQALDVTRKVTRLALDKRVARRLGPPGDQTPLLARVRDDIAVALCAETVGACDRALEMATEYAKVRVQFDRPIATFQAIRHKIVDMLHQVELCRVGTHYAAWASEVNDPLREEAVAMAKGFVGEAANMITAENIQVHGGVGFTWDVDCHLLFRRVKQNDVLYGSQAWQRRRLADLVLGAPRNPPVIAAHEGPQRQPAG